MKWIVKQLLILGLFIILINGYTFSSTIKKYTGHGVHFEYSKNYKLLQSSGNYADIQLWSRANKIILQIYNTEIDNRLEKLYLNTFINESHKSGTKIETLSKGFKELKIKDINYNNRISVKSNYYLASVNIQSNKGIEHKIVHFFIFNYGKKGYIITYFHSKALKNHLDFKLFIQSLLFLTSTH